MKKILRSKLFKFMFVLIVAAGLFIFSNYIDQQVNGIKVTTEVYVVTKDLESKHEIRNSDIRKIEIELTDEPNHSIKNKNDLVGKFIIEPVTKGSFILDNNISQIRNFESSNVPKGYKMISIPLSIDNAVGWKIEKGQTVEMIFSPIQYKNVDGAEQLTLQDSSVLYSPRAIHEVIIVDIMNEALVSIDNSTFAGTPKYVVIQVKSEDAEFIAKAKDKGRFDILISGIN